MWSQSQLPRTGYVVATEFLLIVSIPPSDEPTNHLDIETIEALGLGLSKYEGGVILVSHDQRLITMVCQELWVCSKGKVWSMEGGLPEYVKLVEKEMVLT